ncbi:SDR family oxidoreductase [Roseateles sp. DAIF2]|uniref:SDR family oxidoreductase n=1 Tax=Roseateles sp. DAIF2 TaxID=2714952 RepID=UPI0018A26AC5|nr:SDR family NAD(P)-dependent oxidoreductase [Roseateles sp. DAIF2]QPF74140.1 SDR family oxidoreductase [Roseateles sp. DAIF2]
MHDGDSLRGKVVLITGGGRRLGCATAQRLGEAGARLVLADPEPRRARERALALGLHDIEALGVGLDVGDARQCAAAVASVQARYGRLDALINNAALDATAPLPGSAGEDWRRVLTTHLLGPLTLAKQAATLMPVGQGGHIVNIAATAGRRSWPSASAYHATKWGLLGLSHALHQELRGRNIQVCALLAGALNRPFEAAQQGPAPRPHPLQVADLVRRLLLQEPRAARDAAPALLVLPDSEPAWA